MTTMTLTQSVKAPPERVFGVFTDIAGALDHITAIMKIDILTEGDIGSGTRWKETRVMMGRECTEELAITEFDPARHYTVESDSCGSHFVCHFDFESDGDVTEVTMNLNCEPMTFFAKVMIVLIKPFAGRMMCTMQAEMQKDLEELAAVAEAA